METSTPFLWSLNGMPCPLHRPATQSHSLREIGWLLSSSGCDTIDCCLLVDAFLFLSFASFANMISMSIGSQKEKVTATGTPTWQYGISGVLGVLTFLSMVQIGLVTQVSKLPPEVVRYLTNPQLPEGQIPEELLSIDPTPFVLGALPIAGALAVSAGVHELAHWSIAKLRNMRINIPFFVPNGQVGTFGAVTQLQEPAR